jgi:hypothetical protein
MSVCVFDREGWVRCTDFAQTLQRHCVAKPIMTDYVGFGAASAFGGPIPIPTMDKLANAA